MVRCTEVLMVKRVAGRASSHWSSNSCINAVNLRFMLRWNRSTVLLLGLYTGVVVVQTSKAVKQRVRKFPDSHSQVLFASRPRTRLRRVQGRDIFLFFRKEDFFGEEFLLAASLCIYCDHFYSILLQY